MKGLHEQALREVLDLVDPTAWDHALSRGRANRMLSEVYAIVADALQDQSARRERICPVCGEEFVPSTTKAVYCSKGHYMADYGVLGAVRDRTA